MMFNWCAKLYRATMLRLASWSESTKRAFTALVWQKIGDYHYAEDIMQDAFLQAYKKLSTLKDPNQFAGWLYVIANRLCKAFAVSLIRS